jgi:uncharacterized protein (DUF362 family)
MEGNGPISGTPVHAGVLVFGRDPVAVDATAAELMRVNPERIEYLHEAGRFLGQSHLDRIEQRGDDVTRNSTPFALLPQFASLRS